MSETIGGAQGNHPEAQTPKKAHPPPFYGTSPSKNKDNDAARSTNNVNDENHCSNTPRRSSAKSSSFLTTTDDVSKNDGSLPVGHGDRGQHSKETTVICNKRPSRAAAEKAMAKLAGNKKRRTTTIASSLSSSFPPSTVSRHTASSSSLASSSIGSTGPTIEVSSSSSSSSVASNEGDGIKTIGVGDEAAVVRTIIPEGTDYHETESGIEEEYTEANGRAKQLDKEREAYLERYSLSDIYDAEENAATYNLDDWLRKPSDESYKEPEKKLDILMLCEEKDGKDVLWRCTDAMNGMSAYVQKIIGGFLGRSKAYEILVESKPRNGVWVTGWFCPVLEGQEKDHEQGVAKGVPGSLKHTIGGDNSQLSGMKPGDIREFQHDIHDNVLFRVKCFDPSKEKVADVKKRVAANADFWSAALVRMDVARSIKNGNGGGSGYKPGDQRFFSVTKEGDESYGVKYFKSVNDLTRNGDGRIGLHRYDPKAGKVIKNKQLGKNDFPSKVGKSETIAIKKRGEEVHSNYTVTCITADEYHIGIGNSL